MDRPDREQAIDRAVLYTLQLSNIQHARFTPFGPREFVRSLEQDGWTVVLKDRISELEAEVQGLKEQLGAAGYVPRPALPPKFITEPNYDEPTVPPPPLTDNG